MFNFIKKTIYINENRFSIDWKWDGDWNRMKFPDLDVDVYSRFKLIHAFIGLVTYMF